ncbi:aspartic proteinase 36-like isoform X1 [Zingiber officinale]|uniref:aspartic proteinase 36-like isoform X1 n=1 Tax=Zingiber officinale TaxID=94328 RepID=UPI001C4AC0D4|nr:aspartic proteinase 36-like isoform X1 [Zingiber officinale]
MALRRRMPSSFFCFGYLFIELVVLLGVLVQSPLAGGNGVFRVRHKFLGRSHTVGDLRAHDRRRHSRILAAADLPIGGVGIPTDTGLYFAEIGIGNPSKNYYVQVDTGSDILWVNCISCTRCPLKSDLGLQLTLYDPRASASGDLVSCDEKFCVSTYGDIPGCVANLPCQYSVLYGDGSSTTGYFVTDTIQYDQVSGNHQTKPVNASVTFGLKPVITYIFFLACYDSCGAQQSGDLGSSNEALDGILGFGQSNSSMLSQLASAGKVSKIFAHCLDTTIGGGIFTIGHVVQPKVKTTPLVPGQMHYNVNLKAIEVGGSFLQLPTDIFDTGDKKGTVIDSGTTLAYLPEVAYNALMSAILSNHQGLRIFTIQDFMCFQYSANVDDGFPEVVFHFENSLLLNVYPHDYLFQNTKNVFCFGWQNGAVQSKDGKDMFLLGDLALTNKLVLYDLENQVIGWTEYNCSSSIRVQDDRTGATYIVDAHNISQGRRSSHPRSIFLLLLMFVSRLIC